MSYRYSPTPGQCRPSYFEQRGTEDLIFITDKDGIDVCIAIGEKNAEKIAMALNKERHNG